MQKDSQHKRNVASPRPMSLRENMGQSKPAGFGTPNIGPSKVNEKLRSGKGAASGKGGAKAGIKSKTGYDVKTRVNVGGRAK